MPPEQIALRIVNHDPGMIAYWDSNQRCVFANDAYMTWFGRTRLEMRGISLMELLGQIYEKNLPYILGAIKGERQVFERQLTLPNGEIREAIATYTPDIVNDVVERILGSRCGRNSVAESRATS
jgi:PAS domain-containing protein